MLELGIARCVRCGARFRVLPCYLLPRKQYALTVIECAAWLHYAGHSLRQVVWSQLGGEHTPAHTTLHAWTEGFGAYALGRLAGELPDTVPASRLVAESERRSAAARAVAREPLAIDRHRFRSPARHERLLAGKRLLLVGVALGCGVPVALSHLHRLTLQWGSTCGLGFRTGLRHTPIEHAPGPLRHPRLRLHPSRCTHA